MRRRVGARAIRGLTLFALVLFAACGGEDEQQKGAGSGGKAASGGAGGSSASGGGSAAGGAGGSAGSDASTGGSTSITSALEAAGFATAPGTFRVLDLSSCCDPGKTCSGNNPTSPYAAFYLPRAPGQTVANPNEESNGTSLSFRLAADEAVVYVGATPPAAKYFGFTPYLVDRVDALGNRRVVFASLSETLNNGVVAVDGPTAFSAPTAVIAAADQNTEQKVKTALVSAGVAASAINTIVIDEATVKLGVEDAADTIGILFRVALFDDPVAGKTYLDAPPGVVLRVTPKTPGTTLPLPAPSARPKDLTSTEASLKTAVDELETAILAKHVGFTGKSLVVTQGEPSPDNCIQKLSFCAGDNRDTIYPSILPRPLFVSVDDFYVIFGVNHAATNKATYASFSVYAIDHLVGVASVTTETFAGSAADYLANHPDVSKLYAWKVARQCGSDPHCLAIADAGCPTGVGAGNFGTITFRAYLEPKTSTAPDPATLVIDRVLRFTKN